MGFEEEKNCTSQRGQFLNNFDSPRDFSEFCLAHVFTYRDFDNGTAGLASVGTGLLIIANFLVSNPLTISLNYIKQLRLKDTLHWTPLYSKEKLHTHEYDIPLDRAGHW